MGGVADRYVFDAVLSAERVPNLVRCLMALMPSRVFPILDVLGHDAFREIDPFVAYDQVGLDRVIEAVKQVPAFFFEDGLWALGRCRRSLFLFLSTSTRSSRSGWNGAQGDDERLLAAFGARAVRRRGWTRRPTSTGACWRPRTTSPGC